MSTSADIGALIQAAHFAPATFRAGYRTADVDDFLDEIVALTKDPVDPAAAWRHAADKVRGAQFANETFRESYDMEDVDDFLDATLLPALEDGAGAGASSGTPRTSTITADGQARRDGPTGAEDGQALPDDDGWSRGFTTQEEQEEDPLIAHLLGARFPQPSWLAVNYPVHEVDSLLDDMAAALKKGPDRTAGRREARRALQEGSLDRSRKRRESYRAHDVDMFLMDVYSRLQGG